MEVKEAIEFLESKKWAYYLDIKDLKKTNEVIDLLKRGRKFEEIWEEFRRKYGFNRVIMDTDEEMSRVDELKYFINKLEQKYFPR